MHPFTLTFQLPSELPWVNELFAHASRPKDTCYHRLTAEEAFARVCAHYRKSWTYRRSILNLSDNRLIEACKLLIDWIEGQASNET